ncbi:hypothetical protein ANN_02736 [Periplaneta americana]|uniref:Uncharacterized protein n=1 Tax=Periplaneta americana TaxID=6978 RepID=A0ABQ8U1L2_PERAM|nr:hypothetical protein ANN_02736 [Periplaneta americana]
MSDSFSVPLLFHRMMTQNICMEISYVLRRCDEQETLPHVLGFCHHGELLRINTHNTVRSLIAASIRQNASYEVFMRRLVASLLIALARRADIIITDRQKDKGVILDPTIRFEMDEQQPQEHIKINIFQIFSTKESEPYLDLNIGQQIFIVALRHADPMTREALICEMSNEVYDQINLHPLLAMVFTEIRNLLIDCYLRKRSRRLIMQFASRKIRIYLPTYVNSSENLHYKLKSKTALSHVFKSISPYEFPILQIEIIAANITVRKSLPLVVFVNTRNSKRSCLVYQQHLLVPQIRVHVTTFRGECYPLSHLGRKSTVRSDGKFHSTRDVVNRQGVDREIPASSNRIRRSRCHYRSICHSHHSLQHIVIVVLFVIATVILFVTVNVIIFISHHHLSLFLIVIILFVVIATLFVTVIIFILRNSDRHFRHSHRQSIRESFSLSSWSIIVILFVNHRYRSLSHNHRRSLRHLIIISISSL